MQAAIDFPRPQDVHGCILPSRANIGECVLRVLDGFFGCRRTIRNWLRKLTMPILTIIVYLGILVSIREATKCTCQWLRLFSKSITLNWLFKHGFLAVSRVLCEMNSFCNYIQVSATLM